MASHTRSVLSASRMVLPGEDLGGHGRAVGHARAADGLDQGFLDDAVLHVQGQLAGALLRRAPAHAVGEAGDVLDLLGLHPAAFFGNGRRTVIRSLRHTRHVFDFGGVDHCESSLVESVAAEAGFAHLCRSTGGYGNPPRVPIEIVRESRTIRVPRQPPWLAHHRVQEHHQNETNEQAERGQALIPATVRLGDDFVADDEQHGPGGQPQG